MRTVVLSSYSSKSTATEDDGSDAQNSLYFPGCRKDANCKCEICLASINATLDLMPMSIQRNSLTKLSSIRQRKPIPVPFDPSLMSTPKSSKHRVIPSPALKSTARMGFRGKVDEEEREKKAWGLRFSFSRLFMCLSLIYIAEFGFSWVVSRVLRPQLSPDIVSSVARRSLFLQNDREKLRFLEKELHRFVDGKVSICSHNDSPWTTNVYNSPLNSRCTLYKSATEEVSIWGWPLQTAGLLLTGFSSRSFTVISGRIAEWSDGKFGYHVQEVNSTWVLRNWSASVLQLDPNTWVVEYRRSSILDRSRLFSALLEFLRLWLTSENTRMKQKFWLLSSLYTQFSYNSAADRFEIPT